jgi:hypothetical protein
MKVEKKKPQSFYIPWLPAGTYHKKSGNLEKKNLQKSANFSHFFTHEKSFV